MIRSSSVDYRATIDDPRVAEVRILRPQEIPVYVAEGLFDLGITGRDWVEETAERRREPRRARVLEGDVATRSRVVVAVAEDSEVERVEDLPDGVRVTSEYPELTRRFFAERGVQADVRLSYGASEAKIPDIADCVVDITETGRALRAAGLRVIDTILTSYTEVIANPTSYADPAKRTAMEQLMTLLHGALEARGKVLLKLNVTAEHRDAVLAVLPSAKSPTVNQLANGDYAIESVVAEGTASTWSSRPSPKPVPPTCSRSRSARSSTDAPDERPTAPVGHRVRRGEGPRRDHDDAGDGVPVPLHRDRRRHADDRRSGTPVCVRRPAQARPASRPVDGCADRWTTTRAHGSST